MIFDKQKKTAELWRLQDDAGLGTRSWVKIADILVWIYARSDQEIALHEGSFSKSYSGRVDVNLDVREADRIIQNGIKYDVSGVRTHEYGRVASRRLLLEVPANNDE